MIMFIVCLVKCWDDAHFLEHHMSFIYFLHGPLYQNNLSIGAHC